MPNADTWVLVPVYNEGPVIAGVVRGLLTEFSNVVCVDDGSIDNSAAEILHSGAHLVQHAVNLGQGAALQTGIEYALRHAAARYFVTYDADGQHRVEDAVAMLGVLRSGDHDVVFGSRFLDDRTQLTPMKNALLRVAVRYMNATSGLVLTDAHNGLRVFNRPVATALDIQQPGMAHASEITTTIAKRGFRYTEIPVHILYTQYSRSKGQSMLNAVNILFDLLLR
jgi:glycosyltransferase involved in cell wall biosynthesis